MEIVKQIVECVKSTSFICSICQENIKDPLLLPCNHSFCAICFKTYQLSSPVKNNKNYNCPNCCRTFPKRSAYSAPDLEGQLFKDLVLLLEIETGVDLTDIHAKELPLVEHDKQRYILKQNENNASAQKMKLSVQKRKEVSEKQRVGVNVTKTDTVRKTETISKRIARNVSKKRASDTEIDSTLNKRKKSTNKKIKNEIENNFAPQSIEKTQTKNVDNKLLNVDGESTSMFSFTAWNRGQIQNLKTYKRKIQIKDVALETPINTEEKVELWLNQIPCDIVKLKRSKSLTPGTKSKTTLSKNKSSIELGSQSPTEIARNLESEVLNDLLQIHQPKTNNCKENWTRVKKEFRTSKLKKLDLSVQSSNRKSTRTSTKIRLPKQADVITDSVNDDNKLVNMIPHVVLENFDNSFLGFGKNEQQRTEINKDRFLSTSQTLTNSLIKSSKSIVNLVDQLTTHILNENVKFSSFFIFKECVNISKKLRELTKLKEISSTTNLFTKEIGINTENNDIICPKCHLSNNNFVDLTQKLTTTDYAFENTQKSNTNKLGQKSHSMSRQTSVNSFMKNQNKDVEIVNINSGSSLEYLTSKNLSNTSKFMHDILYDISDMEFTQTITSKNTVPDLKMEEENENSPPAINIDDDDIIESTPKSNKSIARMKDINQKNSFRSQISNAEETDIKTLCVKNVQQQSESEMSEHPSIIPGTEYTQKVPKSLKKKKNHPKIDSEENQLDLTFIEPIETQVASYTPIVTDLPPPTEFMDTDDDDGNENKTKRNNLNNFSALPEVTMLKNLKTPASDINIQQLKEGSILYDANEPITSIGSVVEQTPLSCYPPKSRINLSNTKAFKQVSKKLSTSDSETDTLLEIVKEYEPIMIHSGPSNSKQVSILSYVNSNKEKHGKLSESQISISKPVTNTPIDKKLSSRMNPPPLQISMSSQKKIENVYNSIFKSQFDIPLTQSLPQPMATSTPRCDLSNRKGKIQQRLITLFWTRLSISQINVILDFCKQFNIRYTTENNDTTTHLITQVDENNFVEDYTLKYVCAVARGVWILSFKWIEDCLDNNKILPEEPYEAYDTTGSPGPKMSRLREKPSILLETFAFCVVSSPETFPRDKLINCILQNGGTIYSTIEELASHKGKVRLIITESPETQDIHTFQDYYEKYGILSIITEWVFNTIATFKVDSLLSYLVCNINDIVPEEYPPDLLLESEIMCDSTYDKDK